ncbi:DUF4148 domain-containing protein [Paraburkholderia youngii]|uniref:DUF4148 domain-containing protein n=1 Tax=Paraburkholderia youngii TaxID=2782701 RepID=A0A7Y6JW51_9BURK|nr:DUF4148 domain-containing protein [Paraburkholderia youngii]NUX99814.1 DUF4148 domain-containing protein [Paraburkholderia youngii]
MKSLTFALAFATALIVPITSFAQSEAPMTRARARAELVQLEHAGWRPSAGDDAQYPDDIQAAEATVAKTHRAPSGTVDSASATRSTGRARTEQIGDDEASSYSPPTYIFH